MDMTLISKLQEKLVGRKVVDVQGSMERITIDLDNNTTLEIGSRPDIDRDQVLTFHEVKTIKEEL